MNFIKISLNFFFVTMFFVLTGCDKDKPNAKAGEPGGEVQKPAEPQKVDLSKFDPIYNDMARFFAGLEVDSTSSIYKLFETTSWKQHAQIFGERWKRLETDRIIPVREWSATELKNVQQKIKNVFYPFGGPDFLFVKSFFTDAEQITQVGLEPVGKLPDLNSASPQYLGSFLQDLQGSLNVLLSGGYFKTIDMEVDFKPGRLNGVVPVLMLFLARTNCRVLNVEYFDISAEGKFTFEKDLAASADKNRFNGVLISFMDSDEYKVKKLYFLNIDLSDGAFTKMTGVHEFINGQKPYATMLKAASYLMHRENFSDVRNLVLQNSDFVLQEDSGIPLKYFGPEWKPTFYGVYVGPIPMFEVRYQNDVNAEYKKEGNAKPLPFGIGYQWYQNRSNLMTFEKTK
ncbi:MAG: hypothetical protein IAE91_10805 [Ignavibacteriaceae bacterium]|nr:hypothetical protein [Ignavibacteriaceae bacterium]